MSAAAPLPYPGGGASSHDPRPPPSNGFNTGGERMYEHVEDLVAKAAQGYNPSSSIQTLMVDAERSLNQADFLLSFGTNGRPDLAFVEFLRATEIVTNVIPHHKDYTHFTIDQPEPAKKLSLLQRGLFAKTQQFEAIKAIIKNNNSRSGVQPQIGKQNGHVRTESAPPAPVPSGRQTPNGVQRKPAPSPKPERLHGRALSTAVNDTANGVSAPGSTNGLDERFARLRMLDTASAPRPDSRGSNASSVHSSPMNMPSATDRSGRASFDVLSRTPSYNLSKPQGPRDMANGSAQMPPPITIPGFPQAPAAAYSPARNMETTGNIAPPRQTPRSLASSSTRRSTLGPSSAASAHAPNGLGSGGDYFPPTGASSAPRPNMASQHRRSSNVPAETEISAEKLYDYCKLYSVLLIDFRSREDFDRGHIFHSGILCVDPLTMRQGMSADDLADSLVLSPEKELAYFQQRDEYDFVVYYDTTTKSEQSVKRPRSQHEEGMKWLNEALWDFNLDHRLQRPPMLLKGGIEAWIDMMGEQALVTSDTASTVKTGRPIARRPLASVNQNADGQLRMSKRRARTFDPLDPDEVKWWQERARAESVVLPRPGISEDGAAEAAGDEGEEDGASLSAIREFNERFPDAENLDRTAFASQRPSRAPPDVPAKVPMYPPAPAPSPYPQAPTRPMPAAPRMSYQGVSDRQPSGGQPTNGRQMTPYVPPRFLANNVRLPRTGLVNFRNTCYMNSTIQALSATTPLSVLFMDDGYRSLTQNENWKGSKGQMPDHYANLIRNLWKGDVEVVKPTTFRQLMKRLNNTFNNDDQQDAKELLDCVMDYLHEDMNKHWSRTPLKTLTEDQEAQRERMPKLIVAKLEWARSQHRDLSFINNLFAGQHASRLICQHCNFTSTTYETFTSLSVEIPQSPRDWRNGRFPTLDDCLRSYCSEEQLTKDDQWKCPRCKTFREARKQITLTRAPQFLIIHFKRFASRGSRSQKIRLPVDFPLNKMSLDPYMLPPPTQKEMELIAAKYRPEQYQAEASMTPPYMYDAYAVVRHIGATMQSGHYITAAKDQGRRCWHLYDDSRVHDFQPEQLRANDALQNDQAYIVFYQRTQPGPPNDAHGKI